jgi:hypothetical protein
MRLLRFNLNELIRWFLLSVWFADGIKVKTDEEQYARANLLRVD